MMERTDHENSGHVLIVEDSSSDIQLLSDILMSRGHRVCAAQDGPTALSLLHTDLPDLILLDITMPVMNGYEVCRRLKADKQTQHIPVIFISGLTDPDDIVRAFDVGGVDYITKPFKISEVLARVASQLTLVSQRKQIEALREQDRQYFESLDRMKNEFIRTATHDLRNPINVIVGYAGMLAEVKAAPPDQLLLQQAVQGIEDSLQKMQNLVTDMLNLVQMEARTTPSMSDIPLVEFLQQCIKDFEPVAQQKGIGLKVSSPPKEVVIPLDPDRMQRVVDNLMSNAIKYTPEGGQIEIAIQVNAEQAVIRITDTGLGIPKDDIPHLFEPFFRVNATTHRGIEGTGLGLSIVKKVIEQHNGQIDVESVLGEGSVFSITLPLPGE
jgi:signal transduction histidine kinase